MAPALTHDYFMGLAINQAKIAHAQGDAPVGAVLVQGNRVIGRGRNQREEKNDPTAHAEILALRDAAEHIGQWRLEKCSLYVTLEPCIMCAGAIVQSHIEHLFYGAADPKAGGIESLYHIAEDARLNHRVFIHPGLRQQECERMLLDFFENLRQK
jgi:tRNA(adenine34) deaminase